MNIKTNKFEYIERDGCHDCNHCFVYHDYDSTLEYYCDMDSNRPKCGSVQLKEDFDFSSDDIANSEMKAWDDWSENNKVNPWGICKKWDEE